MKLLGMLDSPYVRRVAIAMLRMQVPFTHESVSVFRDVERFRAVNPLVKAPSLVCDDGMVLMDSTLILAYAESLADPQYRLQAALPGQYHHALHATGVALAAMEKTVQVYYEESLRPEDKRHMPWHERVSGQMATAFEMLERLVPATGWLLGDGLAQADIDIAVAWRFNQFILPGRTDASNFPRLANFSARAEGWPEFIATPLA